MHEGKLLKRGAKMTTTIIAIVLIAWVLLSALVVLSASMMSSRVSRMEEDMDNQQDARIISISQGREPGLKTMPDYGTD